MAFCGDGGVVDCLVSRATTRDRPYVGLVARPRARPLWIPAFAGMTLIRRGEVKAMRFGSVFVGVTFVLCVEDF